MLDEGVIERGEVVGTGPGSVDVRIQGSDACQGCNACSRVDKDGMVLTDVRDDVGAAQGDTVEVSIPEGTDVRAGVYVYLGPVAALLAGYLVGYTVGRMAGWDPDMSGAALAILSVVVGMFAMRQRARSVLTSERFRPRVRAIMSRGREPRAPADIPATDTPAGDSRQTPKDKEATT